MQYYIFLTGTIGNLLSFLIGNCIKKIKKNVNYDIILCNTEKTINSVHLVTAVL